MEWNEEEEVNRTDSDKVVMFTKEHLAKLREPWMNSLMGKVLGMQIRLPFMTERIQHT